MISKGVEVTWCPHLAPVSKSEHLRTLGDPLRRSLQAQEFIPMFPLALRRMYNMHCIRAKSNTSSELNAERIPCVRVSYSPLPPALHISEIHCSDTPFISNQHSLRRYYIAPFFIILLLSKFSRDE